MLPVQASKADDQPWDTILGWKHFDRQYSRCAVLMKQVSCLSTIRAVFYILFPVIEQGFQCSNIDQWFDFRKSGKCT